MDTDFCVEALEESLGRHGAPEIFVNTDQGSQFTSDAFTGLLKANGIQISMDGKGSWKDNVFVERLWKSVKYEEVYLRAYESVPEARTGLGPVLRVSSNARTAPFEPWILWRIYAGPVLRSERLPSPRRPNARQRDSTYQTLQRCSDKRDHLSCCLFDRLSLVHLVAPSNDE